MILSLECVSTGNNIFFNIYYTYTLVYVVCMLQEKRFGCENFDIDHGTSLLFCKMNRARDQWRICIYHKSNYNISSHCSNHPRAKEQRLKWIALVSCKLTVVFIVMTPTLNPRKVRSNYKVTPQTHVHEMICHTQKR